MKVNLPVTGREIALGADSNILSTTDPKGVITSVNPEFVRISGFEEAELLGQSHDMVRHPDMPPAAFEHLWRTLKAGRPWLGVIKNRCTHGDHYWVSAVVTPLLKEGRIVDCPSVSTRPNPHAGSAARARS